MGKSWKDQQEYRRESNGKTFLVVLHCTANTHLVVKLHKNAERQRRELKKQGFIVLKEFSCKASADHYAIVMDTMLARYPERLYGV